MSKLINSVGVQRFANKLCDANNRKVGSKSLPTALNDIDVLIEQMKTHFDSEYGTPLITEIENVSNVVVVGKGVNADGSDNVENGFTGLELCGRSLVNLYSRVTPSPVQGLLTNVDDVYTLTRTAESENATYLIFNLDHTLFKSNTTYTVIFKNYKSSYAETEISFYDREHRKDVCRINRGKLISDAIGVFRFGEYNSSYLQLLVYARGRVNETVSCSNNILILEGDWSDSQIPEYFQGLRSVGENDGNKYKINITSINKNILRDTSEFKNANREWAVMRGKTVEGYNGHKGYAMSYKSTDKNYSDILIQQLTDEGSENKKVLEDTWYTFSFYAKGGKVSTYIYPRIVNNITQGYVNGIEHLVPGDGAIHHTLTNEWKRYSVTFKTKKIFQPLSIGNSVLFRMFPGYADCVVSNIMLEPGKVATDYTPQISEKKEITLNAPLRAIPNGVRDTIEKINGEWKLVRRCGEIIFDGSQTVTGTSNLTTSTEWSKFGYQLNDCADFGAVFCDKLTYKVDKTSVNPDLGSHISCTNNMWKILFQIKKVNNSPSTVSQVDAYMRANPMKVIYELNNHIIEDIHPLTLQCWKNGSIIIDDRLPVKTTHSVALNKPAQIKKNIEELTELRNRVIDLENLLETSSLEQSLQLQLLNQSINLDK